jgi:chromosome segregation ATPase
MLKNLLGGGPKGHDLAEMQAGLQQMHEAIARYEALTAGAERSADKLRELGAPLDEMSGSIDALHTRLAEIERRFEGMVQLSQLFESLDDRASRLTHNQERAETQIAGALENAERIRSIFEDLSQKVDLAMDLKDRLTAFLDVEKPFQEMRELGDTLRGQMDAMGDQMTRSREQMERHVDSQKLTNSKLEALDRRREELSRDLQDKERRVAGVEHAVHGLTGVQDTVSNLRRDLDSLKALGDFVSQKIAALESQRDAVEGALARADQLDRAMRQIDVGVRQQQDNETALASLKDQVAALRSLHESVADRSSEMVELQRATDGQAQAIRDELALARDEMKNAVERFEFETRGMESVNQRVADVRSALTDFENRYKTLSESARTVEELESRTQTQAGQLKLVSEELARAGQDAKQLQAMRRELDEAQRISRELGEQVARLDEARPALEATLRDMEQLGRSHAMVKDALEHSQAAYAEIARQRETHAETQTWLGSVEVSVDELKERVAELRKVTPTIELVQKQARDVSESMSAIEARREFVEELRRRVTDLGALGSNLDERGRQLQTRMEAAEQSFVGLVARADEAERTSKTISGMAANLQQAQQRADEIERLVETIGTRCDSVEEIAEQSRALKQELEQRQHTLKDAAKELHTASALRQEAAAAAQKLDDHAKRLLSSLATAEQRATEVGSLSSQLEDRTASLQSVEKRLGQFEERLAKWDLVDQSVTRSLEQLTARQDTVEALQADLERMFATAEKTANDVRLITSAHREIADSRTLLEDVRGRLEQVRDTASTLEEREREMARAEQRLASAQALLSEVRSSLKALLEQRVIVDQAVEKAGSLTFLLRQADAMIEVLREERKMTSRVRAAGAFEDDSDSGEEDLPKAA